MALKKRCDITLLCIMNRVRFSSKLYDNQGNARKIEKSQYTIENSSNFKEKRISISTNYEKIMGYDPGIVRITELNVS